MGAILVVVCLALSGWGWFQYFLGEVYTHTGMTQFSPIDWISRDEDPSKFWGMVLSQGIGGIILAILAYVRVM